MCLVKKENFYFLEKEYKNKYKIIICVLNAQNGHKNCIKIDVFK
jgi:hypothetical protein